MIEATSFISHHFVPFPFILFGLAMRSAGGLRSIFYRQVEAGLHIFLIQFFMLSVHLGSSNNWALFFPCFRWAPDDKKEGGGKEIFVTNLAVTYYYNMLILCIVWTCFRDWTSEACDWLVFLHHQH